MVEPLLRCNLRIAMLGMGLAVLVMVAGGLTFAWAGGSKVGPVIGSTLLLLGFVWFLFTLWVARRPRLGYCRGELLVYLRMGKPLHIPIDVVEVFFLGQGPATGKDPRNQSEEGGIVAANVVVRLSEAATEWRQRDVNVALGVWQQGYITLRGLWCERLNGEIVQRMNRRLVEIKRNRRGENSEVAP